MYQQVAEGISLKLPEGKKKYITVVYQEHGGISISRQFGENDTLQVKASQYFLKRKKKDNFCRTTSYSCFSAVKVQMAGV